MTWAVTGRMIWLPVQRKYWCNMHGWNLTHEQEDCPVSRVQQGSQLALQMQQQDIDAWYSERASNGSSYGLDQYGGDGQGGSLAPVDYQQQQGDANDPGQQYGLLSGTE